MMKRKEFLKTSAAAACIPYLMLPDKTSAADEEKTPDVVAVSNGEPAAMVDKAIEALGGMKMFVKKGQTVAVKPNVAWRRPPENGANTNPHVVKRIIEHCLDAGAGKVYVFDHAVQKADIAYQKSGIGKAAKAAGGIIVPADKEEKYQKTEFKKAKWLKERAVHETWLEADVLIDLPVLKQHRGAKMTCGIKNLMGCVWDRNAYHNRNTELFNTRLQQNIADFLTLRKPDLTVVDAYRVTLRMGPQKADTKKDVVTKKMLFASPDVVAADAIASRVLIDTEPKSHQEELRFYKTEDVSHIKIAHEMGLGNMNLDNQAVKRITM